MVNAPTSRTDEYQAKIYDLAEKYFTGYELQELRTRLPGIRFAVEEADMYRRNILHSDRKLLWKLQQFVGSVYIYDLLTANLRELNDRVQNATQTSLIDTSREEMAKLANALRGYVAVECDKAGTTGKTTDNVEGGVHLGNVPHNIVANITALEANTNIPNPPVNVNLVYKLQSAGPIGSDSEAIRAFALAPTNVPSPTYLAGGDAADDCLPARLIYQLASATIDCSYLSMEHRKRLAKLEVDFPPIVDPSGMALHAAAKRFQMSDPGAGGGAVGAAIPGWRNAFPSGINAKKAIINQGETPNVTVDVCTNADMAIAGPPGRLGSQFKEVVTGNMEPFYKFENVIARFIKRDILKLNGIRSQILNMIANWWKRNGALSQLDANGVTDSNDPVDFNKKVQKAMYAVTGSIGKCSKGSSIVWYDQDPSNPKARIVDETITASDGSVVRNPFAKVGVCADEPFQADEDGMGIGWSGAPTGAHYTLARRATRRHPRRNAAKRTRRPTRRYY
eukprot:jgi/Mesvir1/16619/Mv10153-RA.1